jgi:iron complex outermembrane receptor protein
VQSEIIKGRVLLLRNCILFIAVSLSLSLNGQISMGNDTIKIREVIIRKNKTDQYLTGYKKAIIDSTVLVNYNTQSLSDLISENTGIFIKSYGMGGIATPSFRGTGASHTIIDWNGININSPMLGQSDLSIIPVGLIDNIQIYYGGASMSLNNGGIGGTISLETKPVWDKKTSFSSCAGIGSFGQFSGFLTLKTGNDKFQTVTKGFYQWSENNFRYLNNEIGQEPVWQTRTNSQVNQHGLIQEFYFRGNGNVTSARIWYQSSDRNLPGTLLTEQTNTGEKQFDESLRTMLNYDAFKGNSSLSFTGAWMLNRSDYFNKLAAIDSRNLAEILTLKAVFENSLSEYTKLKIILDDQSDVIKSNNYNHKTNRNTATLTASVERNRERFGTTLIISEILDKSVLLIPDFSSAVRFRLIDGKEYYLKASFSRNSKLPAMNDMYWEPGGNPGLKNEYAMMYEMSYEMDQKISDRFNFKYNMSVFRYNMKDMIQWHSGEYSYWTADNIKTVRSSGLEAAVSMDYILNNLKASLKAGYTFTKAISGGSDIEDDISKGKQLMYIPVNQVTTSFRIGYRHFYSSLTANLTGKRYITVDNSKYLSEYFINNLMTGIKLPLKSSSIDLNFNIDNLFNINYQSIAYYPLPGRSYLIKIFVQIFKKP